MNHKLFISDWRLRIADLLSAKIYDV